jgi:hypothetical protein
MISPGLRKFIYVFLVLLVILDLVLSTTCLIWPDKWFMTFHGVHYDNLDVMGLLKRTGAVWVAFTLLQLIAVFKWEKAPWWLILIAGVRLTELFSDWTYMYVAKSMTTWGNIGLFISPPGNLVFGLFLIWAYKRMTRGGHQPVAT